MSLNAIRRRARTAGGKNKIAVATRSAKVEESASGNTGSVLFKLACLYARTSQALRADAELAIADRNRLAEQYAASAVHLLGCAEQVGFFGTTRPANRRALRENADLAVLRPRADFRQLEARLR